MSNPIHHAREREPRRLRGRPEPHLDSARRRHEVNRGPREDAPSQLDARLVRRACLTDQQPRDLGARRDGSHGDFTRGAGERPVERTNLAGRAGAAPVLRASAIPGRSSGAKEGAESTVLRVGRVAWTASDGARRRLGGPTRSSDSVPGAAFSAIDSRGLHVRSSATGPLCFVESVKDAL
jgi:hypothetical protein